jgi:hypothetical protein
VANHLWRRPFGRRIAGGFESRKTGRDFDSEVWGPLFEPAHDATYENGWILNRVNRGWLQGAPFWSAKRWMRWKRWGEAARPPRRMPHEFCANHDMSALIPLGRESRFVDALSFLHAFSSGLPFVFWPELAGREAFFNRVMTNGRVSKAARAAMRWTV